MCPGIGVWRQLSTLSYYLAVNAKIQGHLVSTCVYT